MFPGKLSSQTKLIPCSEISAISFFLKKKNQRHWCTNNLSLVSKCNNQRFHQVLSDPTSPCTILLATSRYSSERESYEAYHSFLRVLLTSHLKSAASKYLQNTFLSRACVWPTFYFRDSAVVRNLFDFPSTNSGCFNRCKYDGNCNHFLLRMCSVSYTNTRLVSETLHWHTTTSYILQNSGRQLLKLTTSAVLFSEWTIFFSNNRSA
jgi:hypothetical protein